MIPQLKTSNLKEAFQRFVRDFVRPLEDNAQLDYVDVGPIALGAGVNTVITHGLGRVPIGWFMTDLDARTTYIYRVAWDIRELTLRSQAACNANFRIY